MKHTDTRRLGATALNVTQLGFGGAPLGSLYAKLDEDEAVATVRAAYQSGVRLFDTAPLYGYGLSEMRMGWALRRFPRSVALEERFAGLLPEVLLGVDPARFADLAAAVLRPKPPPSVGVDHLHTHAVSVAEHVAILRERLSELGEATFAALTADCTSALEVIARFMAVLELFREATIAVDQPECFGELTVRWTPPGMSSGPEENAAGDDGG